jgi:hypothetical protein
MKNTQKTIGAAGLVLLLIGVCILFAGQSVQADPHSGQSVNVVIIGGTTLDTNVPCGNTTGAANSMTWTAGGCLPVTGSTGELGDFNFTAMAPSAVSAASLGPFDTAVLNVASSAMACNTNTLNATQQADIIAFVASGKKLIIFDSECYPGPVDYSWLPYPFTTANPGAMGAPGTLTVVQDNFLSTLVADPSCTSGDTHCIDVAYLGPSTDAVGDMNVMTTYNPYWCLDMSGKNYLGITGPVHTYAKYPAGTDTGLIIYNGLDQDYLYIDEPNLRKIWVQELQQPFNPSNLSCIPVVGIKLDPMTDENVVGEDHTVTATLTNEDNIPQGGILVTFSVISGPNAGATGTCSPNADCTTDANGEVSFTYTGTTVGQDKIVACFVNEDGKEICSQEAQKDWVSISIIQGVIDIKPQSCPNPLYVNSKGALPVAIIGTESLDVTQIDPATVRLEGVAPIRSNLEDVTTPFDLNEDCYTCTEEGPDGYMDLTLKFDAQNVITALGDVEDGECRQLLLTGELYYGTLIEGSDAVVILKKK